MKLATRLFAVTSLLVALIVLAGIVAVERIVWVGLAALGAAALLAWSVARAIAPPLAHLTDAARRIAAGREPSFPDSRVPEIADHSAALRGMATELAARFDALRQEREEAQTLIESLSDGVVATDRAGAVVTCNGAARRLLGYPPSAALPPLAELFHDKGARELLHETTTGREVDQAELRVNDRDLLLTARPLDTGGIALVLRDVTRLRRLEAIRRDFVANVSHELKTPLTSIAGYAETLAGVQGLAPEPREFAQTILANARRMQRLVDDLLDLSRIESGGWRPEPRVVELEPVVREVWGELGERAASRSLRLETDIRPTAHVLLADPDGLRQILTNLLDNAVRHTPPGGSITVSADQGQNGVVLAVQDTGTGISPEHLSRIFERFYRVDSSRARDQGGTGLGLAIVKHLVEAHGGRVEAESALGKGTVIRMTFPT
jgi:two-component system, OmpR family, phosphate regulon sensor histidine kinase PhoR